MGVKVEVKMDNTFVGNNTFVHFNFHERSELTSNFLPLSFHLIF